MAKSIYRQYAAEYRSMAETARSESLRAELLKFARDWEALAEAAVKPIKRSA